MPKSVWKVENNFEVSDLDENKVVFLFQTKDDMEKVLLLSLWSFDKYLFILHKMVRGEAVKDIKFDKTPFWIQIHGLPTMCQTKEVRMSINATLGEVEKVDANKKGFCLGNFWRIRVLLNISMLLCRGRKVLLGEYGLKWVDFKYMRDSQSSVICVGGWIMTKGIACSGFEARTLLRPEKKQFDPWLCATPDKYQKPQLITTMKNGETSTGAVGIVV